MLHIGRRLEKSEHALSGTMDAQLSPDGNAGRLAGIAIASTLSAAFWMAILAIAMPSIASAPSQGALAIIGISIAGFVGGTLLALGQQA